MRTKNEMAVAAVMPAHNLREVLRDGFDGSGPRGRNLVQGRWIMDASACQFQGYHVGVTKS